MEALLSLEPSTLHYFKNLHQLFDKVESHVRGLCALEVPASYGSLLSSILMNKLPAEVKLVVIRNV